MTSTASASLMAAPRHRVVSLRSDLPRHAAHGEWGRGGRIAARAGRSGVPQRLRAANRSVRRGGGRAHYGSRKPRARFLLVRPLQYRVSRHSRSSKRAKNGCWRTRCANGAVARCSLPEEAEALNRWGLTWNGLLGFLATRPGGESLQVLLKKRIDEIVSSRVGISPRRKIVWKACALPSFRR